MTVRRWLHRHGIARLLDSTGNNFTEQGSAYIETRGPALVGGVLCRYALRGVGYPRPNLDTVRLAQREKLAACRYRWRLEYQRVR